MEILKTIIMILFALDCIALVVVVLLQEGKSGGLGSLAGGNDTFWGQNKGRTKEGTLLTVTKVLAVLFLVLAAALNLSVFA